MIEGEKQIFIGTLRLKILLINAEDWYLINSFVYDYYPSFSFSRFCFGKPQNLFKKIPRDWQSSYSNQYVFNHELFIDLISTIPKIACVFINYYFQKEEISNHVQNFEKKMGRPQKKLSEIKSRSRKRERRKIFEEEFETNNNFSFFKFLQEYSFIEEFMEKFDTKLTTIKLVEKDFPDVKLVERVDKKDLLYWKDFNLISYEKIEKMRLDLNLNKILPCKTTLNSFKNALNNLISKRYNIKVYENSVVIENIEQLLNDYLKFTQINEISIKWTSDERKMPKDIGNVGVAFIATNCSTIKTQNPSDYIYICIGNGREDKEFFEKNLTNFRANLNLIMQGGIIQLGSKRVSNLFVADLKHVWENCSIETSPEIQNNNLFDHFEINEELTNLINESQIMEEMIDQSDLDLDLDLDNEIKKRCCFCGKSLQQFHSSTHKKERETGRITPLIKSVHWLGMEVKGFCILHCDQRCFERILYYFGRNDTTKINLITQTFFSFGLVRKGWKFKKQGRRLYPKMLKGTEVEAICSKFNLWKNSFDWISDDEKKLIKKYKILLSILNLKSEEISILDETEYEKYRFEIDDFVETIISLYGDNSIQFYYHMIDFHLLDIIRDGIALPTISQQGFEHSHFLHKRVQNLICSRDAAFHKTPSFLQIMMRQMRLFVNDFFIFSTKEIEEEEKRMRNFNDLSTHSIEATVI